MAKIKKRKDKLKDKILRSIIPVSWYPYFCIIPIWRVYVGYVIYL